MRDEAQHLAGVTGLQGHVGTWGPDHGPGNLDIGSPLGSFCYVPQCPRLSQPTPLLRGGLSP